MTLSSLKIAALQGNFRVGDLHHNLQVLLKGYRQALVDGAEFVLAPELALTGYPPKDLLLFPDFIASVQKAVWQLAAQIGDVPLAFGTTWPLATPKPGDPDGYGQLCTNSYVVAQHGEIVFRTDKVRLAQGTVFNEHRVHRAGEAKVFRWRGLTFGFPICEDIWRDHVVDALVRQGAEVLLVPNGSPTYVGKPLVRHQLVQRHVTRTGVPMLYLNHVGGQDEHVFDGGAFFVNVGAQAAQVFAPYWDEAVAMVTLTRQKEGWTLAAATEYLLPAAEDFILDALVLGTHDYLLKASSLRKLVVGVSGGIDSAVVLTLAKLVLERAGLDPKTHLIAVSLPSKYNSSVTQGYAQQLCDNLGIPLHWWPIEANVQLLRDSFTAVFGGTLEGSGTAADENTQSRERGQVLMAISNASGGLLLSSGNKSEMAVGFATLYGDMNGGFNPLKTLYKTQVFALARALNRRLGCEAIPTALITQAPSPELAADQRDEDQLPPYAVLDVILRAVLDHKLGVQDLMTSPMGAREGVRFVTDDALDPAELAELNAKPPMRRLLVRCHDRYACDTVEYLVTRGCVEGVYEQVLKMRFKRYQAPPGVTVTEGSLDDGEQLPICHGPRDWLTCMP